PAGTYLLTRSGAGDDTGATGDLDIAASKALTITGALSSTTIIDASGFGAGSPDRAFQVLNGATLTISGVTITRGHSGDGGALSNSGTLVISRTILSGNSADSKGGAIYNSAYSKATISGSTISGNSAVNGGGLFNRDYSSLTFSNSTLSGNSASDS